MPLKTSLYEEHLKSNATIVEFAGYSMPVKYIDMIDEHLWVRKSCGIFDVSHMGQAIFEGKNLNEIFSKLTPSNFEKVKESVCKYTVLTNENGGIIDDLIITKITEERFFIVWNASRKHINIAHVLKHFPDVKHQILEDRSLIAIQGPEAFSVMSSIFPSAPEINYMRGIEVTNHPKYGHIFITRTGYTGEKGFEVSVKSTLAPQLWNELLSNSKVKPIGLGARDSLRLEAGYPLYGNDLNETTTPVQASLSWVISKNHTNFIGAQKILSGDVTTKRVGILLEDKGVLRAGYEIFDGSQKIGTLTSGGYSPVLQKSIGQAYLPASLENGRVVNVIMRGKSFVAKIHDISFITTNPK